MEDGNITIQTDRPIPQTAHFVFTYRDADGHYRKVNGSRPLSVKALKPFDITANQSEAVHRRVLGVSAGQVYLGLNVTNGVDIFDSLERVACMVSVMHYHVLDIVQVVIGWIYFAAWTISFYPQVYLNWKRKSVVGFNFDFLFLNVVGFFVYSVFNLALYCIPSIQEEYYRLHPVGVIPVMLNDIFFSVHAFLICIVTGVQVAIYERGGQRVSRICIGILCLIAVYILIQVIIAAANVFTWLTFLYNVSYVKLFITFIKYMPQAVMNCRRKSTVGWSIGNIILDFTGGILSILQMFVIAYNFDDWSSVFGSPVKMGLGIFSILFDIFFMVQHWCLFPHGGEYSKVEEK
jgi:cystinosin